MIRLTHESKTVETEITISGSKSISNRWLILQKLFPTLGPIHNLSNAVDTQVLQRALETDVSQLTTIDIGHAGTAMRFLTAYYAITPGSQVILTGSERMQQRPIEPLVTALTSLGCQIEYMNEEGYPPLKIIGQKVTKKEVGIRADISSQYITALLLIAAKLPKGLSIVFDSELTSQPYVEMTCTQLKSIGIRVEHIENGIQVYQKSYVPNQEIIVESDWSSASYWYSIAALSDEPEINLKSYSSNSLQGDAIIKDIYEKYFGVYTEFDGNRITLNKVYGFNYPCIVPLDLNNTPDLAQTIAVTCAGLKMKAELLGLQTLKIKETDRLKAMQNELSKLNVSTIITDDSLDLISYAKSGNKLIFSTYDDHRMAMAFAPLALKYPIIIEEAEVVEKSYPDFWKDLKKAGFTIQNL